MNNYLIYGDNIDSLVYLSRQTHIAGNIKLVYIDPPYGTGQDFTFNNERFSAISRENDGILAYSDKLTGQDYIQFLEDRLVLIRDLMSYDASIYGHIDTKVGHYVKLLMDRVFGRKNFINDITRIKCNPKNFSRKGYGNIKDMILFYSKTDKYIWNDPRGTVDLNDIYERHKLIDSNGRHYTTTPLHAPGETMNGETGREWRGMLPPKGRHWRYPPSVLDNLDKMGLIEWSSTGNPRKKIYADDVIRAGSKIQDVWVYKDPQNPKYPTEKNLDMLKMIVAASSNEGDYVLDAFAGSGTTLAAASSLNRKWIGIDSSKQAINICKERLNDCTYDFVEVNEPEDTNERMA